MNPMLLLFVSLLCYLVNSVPTPADSRTLAVDSPLQNETLSERLALKISFEPHSAHSYPVEEYEALNQRLHHVIHQKSSDQPLNRIIVRLPNSDPNKPQVQAGIYSPQRGLGSTGGEHPFTNAGADILLRQVDAHLVYIREKLHNTGRASSIPNICWYAFLGEDIFSVARGWYGGWPSDPLVSPCNYWGFGGS